MSIPTKELNVSRQYPLYGFQRFDLSHLENGEALTFAKVPWNSVLVGGFLMITTAFNSNTSDSIIIGDDGGSATADPDRYLTATDVQATGYTALTPTGFQFTTMGALTLTWTGDGSGGTIASEGAGFVVFEYITEGRHSFEVVPSY